MSKKIILILTIVVALIIVVFIVSTNRTKSSDMSKQTDTQPTPASQLKIEDIIIGTGNEVASGSSVIIHYKGTLSDGSTFDSSYERGEPFETKIGVGQVIQGWDEGVIGMKAGGKRKLTIPPEMGYGDQAVGPIPANSTLIFEVELIEVK